MDSREIGLNTNIDLDIRFFRRYPKDIDFYLFIGDRSFRARTIDYSLIGVGIVIDDPEAPLMEGDFISLDISELDLHEKTKVAWIMKTPSGLRVGALRKEPLKGRLSLYPLSDILIGMQRTLKTGILEVRAGSVTRKVYIRNGNITCARSNYEKDRLGDVLLKNRKINKKQYDKAAEMKRKSGAGYVKILIHMGYLKQEDMLKALELQTRRIIGGLFLMNDAEFEFTEGPFSSEDVITLKLSVADLIFREVKKNADVKLLETYLLDSVVDFAASPLDLFQNIRLSASEKNILSCVNGKSDIREIIRLSDVINRVKPLKVIYALLEARFLRLRKKDEPLSGISAGEIFRDKAEKSHILNAEIERLYSEHRRLDYYNILGLSRQDNPTTEQIKKAYYSAAKKYHPDVHLLLAEDAKKKMIEIYTYVTNAYRTLTDPVKRLEYDSVFQTSASQEGVVSESGQGPSTGSMDVQQDREDSLQQSEGIKYEDKSGLALLRFRDGKAAFWNNNLNEAARLFAMALYFDASVPEYHYFYGRTLGMIGKDKEAILELKKADDMKPRNADILAELGHMYMKLDFPLRAQGYFNKAAVLDPSNKRALEGIKKMTQNKSLRK